MTHEALQIGARIGPFRLVARLGEGGFAPVWLAAEEYGGVEIRVVALKLFFTDDVAPTLFAQVVAEARALSRVEHRNVVRYYQIFEDKPAGIFALAMEHVRGESLGARLQKTGPLSIADVLVVGSAIASALASVHAAGLVHRDVKPDNVIDAGGIYKLIDFGIATRRKSTPTSSLSSLPALPSSVSSLPAASSSAQRAMLPSLGDTDEFQDRTLLLGAPRATELMSRGPAITETAMVEDPLGNLLAGTMGYIDPACLATGAPPDPSSDLYALGAMLYECLSLRLPSSPARNSTEIKQSVVFGIERPPPIREVAPNVPEEVARLLDALVDPDRNRRPRHAEAVAAELDRLRRGIGRARLLPAEGPFRGLDAFDERHRDVFFGRASELAIALEGLRSRGLLALVGPSGSGKSSLALAGVIPAVVEGELGGWPRRFERVVIRPGRYPRMAIDEAFTPMFGRGLAGVEPEVFVVTLAARVESAETGIAIYVDALEEIVTVSEARERDWLAEVLAQLARNPIPGVRVIVSVRRDFLDGLLALPALGPMLARSVQLVAPLGGRAFVEALEERLSAYGYALEDTAMFDELARELASAPEAMPLFEFALARLWAERDQTTRRLGRGALARIGGISGALEQHAESTLRALVAKTGPIAEAVTRATFIALTTASGTRTRRTLGEIVTDTRADRLLVESVLATFEQARLVVVEEGRFTLAHETLLQRWPRLRDWVASVRRERELAEETERAASRWKARPADTSLLYRGRAMRDAVELEKTPTVRLSPDAIAFVKASRAKERRSTTGVLVLVGSVFVGMIVLFFVYRGLERDAVKREKEAERMTTTLRNAATTPESERAKAVKALLEDKRACEKELERRAICAPAGADAAVDAGAHASH